MSTDLNGIQINNQEAIRLFGSLVLAQNMMLVYFQDSVERLVSLEFNFTGKSPFQYSSLLMTSVGWRRLGDLLRDRRNPTLTKSALEDKQMVA
jgi:hypothetical protein|mmetsp:Transcript_18527/g.33568  ORF Transcript_18527/g.33568 Transcript_18527/m.33568 type:complete len:93 (+) Transcript_18527:237-515(+)